MGFATRRLNCPVFASRPTRFFAIGGFPPLTPSERMSRRPTREPAACPATRQRRTASGCRQVKSSSVAPAIAGAIAPVLVPLRTGAVGTTFMRRQLLPRRLKTSKCAVGCCETLRSGDAQRLAERTNPPPPAGFDICEDGPEAGPLGLNKTETAADGVSRETVRPLHRVIIQMAVINRWPSPTPTRYGPGVASRSSGIVMTPMCGNPHNPSPHRL